MRQFLIGGFVVLALSSFAGASPSYAFLRVCNKAVERVNVAVGYNSKDYGWTSEGWWQLSTGDCKDLITGDLTNRYYYVYADDDTDGTWEAKDDQKGGFFCVSDNKFTYHNRDYTDGDKIDCDHGGLDSQHFFEVDTGDSSDFTHNLTD